MRNKVIETALNKTQADALTLLNDKTTDDASMVVQDAIQKIQDELVVEAEKVHVQNDNTKTRTEYIMIALVLIGILFSVIIGLFVSRKISKPLNLIAIASKKLSEGDVDVNLNIKSKDEVGNLAFLFQKMIKGIREQAELLEKISDGDMTVNVIQRSGGKRNN